MNRIYTGSLLAFVLIGFGTALYAQDPGQAGHAEQADHPVTVEELPGELIARQATSLDGTEVVSENGDSIGEIDEVVHSNVDGKYYGVIDVGGFLGIGESERLIALEDLEYDADEERLYLSPIRTVEDLAEFDMELFSESDNESTVQIRSRAGA